MTSRLELRVPPDPRHARTVREALVGFGSLNGIAEDDLDTLLFAVGEALANAIEHSKASRDIEVITELSDEQIQTTIIDHGRGFYESTTARAALPDASSERGRGIPIMKRCTDFFNVRSEPGNGTVIVMGKYRRPLQESSAIA